MDQGIDDATTVDTVLAPNTFRLSNSWSESRLLREKGEYEAVLPGPGRTVPPALPGFSGEHKARSVSQSDGLYVLQKLEQ